MLFNSFKFLIFFTVVFFTYWLLKHKQRWILLLISSYFFYMCWKPQYALLLLSSTLASYITGLLIEKYRNHGKVFVWINVLFNFSMLIYFKYLNFLCQTIVGLFDAVSFLPNINIPIWDIILPVGISFMIFQNVGYTTDVYRKRVPVERHFGYYALFASFFPQLVAGPIERTENLLPQLKQDHIFKYEEAATGLRMMLFGFFKKVAVADTIATFVDNVYNNAESYNGLSLILATILFAFQIYCDFSGYSDIALGCAKMLGINLMTNFKSPYFSKSVSEFWRRWHISLSTWFRDNVYIPMGGNRVSLPKHLANLMITFVLSGIWHGAGWNFIIWGALHGAYLCCGVLFKKFIAVIEKNKGTKPQSRKVSQALKTLWIFIITCFAWIFFRANTFNDSIYIIKNLFVGIEFNIEYIKQSIVSMGFTKQSLVLTVIILIILFFVDFINYKKPIYQVLESKKTAIRWTTYISVTCVILYCIMFTSQSQNFIYFQF